MAEAVKEKGPVGFVLGAIGAVLLVLAFLVAVVEGCAFNPAYYKSEYIKNGTAAYVGVDTETLNGATETLLEYLQGTRSSLDYEVYTASGTREYYNEREKVHMADVRVLNENAVRFMWFGFIVGSALVIAAFALPKKKSFAWGGCFTGILIDLCFFAIIGVWAATDFSGFWTAFHMAFFTNDLWLFDPATSLLIRMFEEQFFFDLVAQILAWFLSVTCACLILCGAMRRRCKKVEA